MSDVFAALADPTRREVMRALAARPGLTASALASELPVTRQAVAKHLAVLEAAGLADGAREGRERRYVLTPEPLSGAARWMAEVGGAWDERLARLERRVRSDPPR